MTNDYPTNGRVDDLLEQAVAILMQEELEYNRLDVTLAPCHGHYGDDGRYRRIVESRNPAWYRDLCSEYTSGRTRPRNRKKHDTLIKRQLILRALEDIGNGRCHTVNAQRVYPYVKEEAQKLQAQQAQEMQAFFDPAPAEEAAYDNIMATA